MAEFPRLPFWTDAYLADTKHLTTTEHGAYFLLLLCAWRTSTNSLPDNDQLLRRLAGNPKNWPTIKPKVMAFWRLVDGHWRQKKLDEVRDWVTEKRKKGTTAAEAKWRKYHNTNSANASPKHMQNGSQVDASKSKSIYKEENVFSGRKKEGFKAPPNSPQFVAWRQWGVDNNRRVFVRELDQRTLEGRSFDFETEFPPHMVAS